MKKRWQLFLVLLLLVFFIWASVFHFSSVYQYFLQPAAKAVWLIANLLRAIDQKVFWFLIILSSLGVLIWLIFKRSDEDQSIQKYWADPIPTHDFDRWERLIDHAADNQYFQYNLYKNLLELQKSIDELTPKSGKEQEDGTPSKLRAWKLPVDGSSSSVPVSYLLPGMKRRRLKTIQKNIDAVLADLEKRMETTDGKKQS